VAGAEADARAGLAVAPGDPHLVCALGLVHAERGDLATAEDLFTQALTARPDLTEALVNRATTRFDLGDTRSAIDDLTAALSLDDGADAEFTAELRAAVAECAAHA
jgi:tetratricopeptide (TPR) repeat protein